MEKSLKEYISNCLVSKLSKDYHLSDNHPEYQVRHKKLKDKFQELIVFLETEDFMTNLNLLTNTLPIVYILYLELQTEGPWNINDLSEYSEKLNKVYLNKHNINLNEILHYNTLDSQGIFNIIVEELHKKMTLDDFRKYPSLIDVYCLLLQKIKNSQININPSRVLPVALFLVEDYITTNKIKGLKACTTVLKHLSTSAFATGNYYEVVYNSLKKNIVEKDREVTNTLFPCFIELLKKLPSDIKTKKLDDIYFNTLDQLYSETNLYRKADLLDFTNKIIEMHGVHCAKNKMFKHIICDNIDICSDGSISEILLVNVLECFQTWLKYCWCVWKLSADRKMLSSLLKILYLTEADETKLKIQNLILTLITLCTKEERIDILSNLQEPPKHSNQDFINRLEIIKKHIDSC